MTYTCDYCSEPVELAYIDGFWECPKCKNVHWTLPAPETITLDEWIAPFKVRNKQSRMFWKAIRREFEDQNQEPMTVRQMFYRMSSAGVVSKSEGGYRQIQRQLLNMRRKGAIPYSWITDGTRWVHKSVSFSNMREAMEYWQQNYRRALWDSQDVYVEIWVEKDALAGVFRPITEEYDVPLYVARGFSSETYIQTAAEQIKSIGKPAFVYHFGDHDPSGRDAAKKIAAGMRRFGAVFEFVEAAVTPEQIASMNLPTRPTKKTDSRAKKFKGESCELDAIPPATLRQMIRAAIERHIDQDQLANVRIIEEQEKTRFIDMAHEFGTSTRIA